MFQLKDGAVRVEPLQRFRNDSIPRGPVLPLQGIHERGEALTNDGSALGVCPSLIFDPATEDPKVPIGAHEGRQNVVQFVILNELSAEVLIQFGVHRHRQ